MKITVNGRERIWSPAKISFEDVMKLAYGYSSAVNARASTMSYVYPKAADINRDNRRAGTMIEGDSIPVENGLILNVAPTGGT